MNAFTALNRRVPALLVAALAVFTWSTWPVAAQSGAKRPLTYDAYDYWKSVAGARVSDDGQWFVYSLTSQAEDPELVHRYVEQRHAFPQQQLGVIIKDRPTWMSDALGLQTPTRSAPPGFTPRWSTRCCATLPTGSCTTPGSGA